MSKVGCIISAAYSSRIQDPSDWPTPGVWSATIQWPAEVPSIAAEQLGEAGELLADLAGACGLVLSSAHGALPAEGLVGFIERLQATYYANRLLLRDASCIAELAKATNAEEKCADVTMPTMHAAVLQKACNIAEWQASFATLDDFRRFFTKKQQSSPIVDVPDPSQSVKLPEVLVRLKGETALARQFFASQQLAGLAGRYALPNIDQIVTELRERLLNPNIDDAIAEAAQTALRPGEAATGEESQATRKKRSTEPGEARDKIIAALTAWHQYDCGSCGNYEPIGVRELVREFPGVSEGGASGFFKREFGGHVKYKAACRNGQALCDKLGILNGEVPARALEIREDYSRDRLPARRK